MGWGRSGVFGFGGFVLFVLLFGFGFFLSQVGDLVFLQPKSPEES